MTVTSGTRVAARPSARDVALVAVPTVAILVLGWSRRALSDDGLIYSRPARQVLAGHGPVTTVGERAEAATGTLWQWLLVLAGWASGGDVSTIAVYGGLALTAAGIGLAVAATRRLHGGLVLPAGVLVPLAVPPFWDYASTGLETGLQTAWLAGCWWLLVRARTAAPSPPVAVVLGLGPLVRPDLAVVSAVFLVALLVLARPGRRRAVALLAAAGVLPLGYEVFRAGYYGILVPLPGLAKEASGAQWDRGLRYAADVVGPYWLAVPLLVVGALLVLLGRRAARADLVVVAAPVLCAALLTVHVVRVGGDFMHARMLLPPLLLLVLPVLVVPARRATGALAVVLAVWAAVAVSPLRSPVDGGSAGSGTYNVRLDDVALTGDPHPTSAADWVAGFPELVAVADEAARDGALAFGAGHEARVPLRGDGFAVVGYYLGVTGAVVPLQERVVDYWGLANPLAAHLTIDPRSPVGHEKPLPNEWLLADLGDPAAVPAPGDPSGPAILAARRALQCGDLRELVESVRAPMGVRRFWANLTGAWDRTRLRVPRDPVEAERTFCR